MSSEGERGGTKERIRKEEKECSKFGEVIQKEVCAGETQIKTVVLLNKEDLITRGGVGDSGIKAVLLQELLKWKEKATKSGR